jgi:streptogramin lyase
MRSRTRLLGLGALATAVVLAPSAAGAEHRPQAASVPIVLSWKLSPEEFKTPWQLTWIADGTDDGAVAFTDRGGNAVGVLDPKSGDTRRFPLNAVTSPNGIVAIDFDRFAVAGTGGVAIFDRRGTGKITELQMAGTRNAVIAVGPNDNLFVPDLQSNDLRIIKPPYGGPADITKFPLPAVCRGPTGVIPGRTWTTILCQQTNNIVDLSPTGTLLRTTPLPAPNMGAQEARPAPRGFVFSAFNANRVVWVTNTYPRPYSFVDIATSGAAVPTVGYFADANFRNRVAAAANAMGLGKKPPKPLVFNTFTPSFRGDGFTIGTFPKGTSQTYALPPGSNLVGSAVGPVRVIYIADATPGKPAIHAVTPDLLGGPRSGRTATGYRYPFKRFVSADHDFLTSMTFPFFGPGPGSTPKQLQVGVVASSSSPAIGSTFSASFQLRATATAVRSGGGVYNARVQNGDTGAFTQGIRVTNIEPGTRSVTVTFKGTSAVPVDFGVYAQTPKPEPDDCECKELTVAVNTAQDLVVDAGREGLRLQFLLGWKLKCSGGEGNCTGRLLLSPATGDRAEGLRIDGDTAVSCKARCAETLIAYHKVVLDGGARFGTQRLGKSVRVISLEIDRVCAGTTKTTVVDFAFGGDGKLDLKRSDLNGNGVADGKEKRR